MLEIYHKIAEAAGTNQPAWMVTVLKIFGSTPSRVGAKMLVYLSEKSEGTIGGGNLEQLVKKRIVKEHPETLKIWDIDLDSEAKMACGGRKTCLGERQLPVYDLRQSNCPIQPKIANKISIWIYPIRIQSTCIVELY